jgi:NAD(P)-dependent dehydrogenase (short-subunit alcohol dehydrogenase family)
MAATARSMTGKICVVTGANDGIGKATALGLAKMSANVVMICRSRERGETAQAGIKRESGNNAVTLLIADLSSQAAIRRLATEFTAKYPALHVLINNAGIIPRNRTVTQDGFETQFAVNHLAYFLLTQLLLDTIKGSAPARIVNITSQAHQGATLDFDDLQSQHSYSRTRVYATTKLANILFTYELARRLEGTRVTANCVHPGGIATKLLSDYLPSPIRFMAGIVGKSPEKGAQTPIYLATSPEVEGVTGKYFVDRKAAPSSKSSYDLELARRLWQESAKLTNLLEQI